MKIEGPNGPGPIDPGMNINQVTHVDQPSQVEGATSQEGLTETTDKQGVQQADFEAMLDEAARLLPPEQRQGFKELIKEMAATDPILSSMMKQSRRKEE